ncbi:hypothetical protein [Treponema putidum]|uniref:Uncharacterized protein n=1 Tax=Treponema putidum TaxID=221027 RepID=A0AAE9SKD2_9SPIR|nr:hypothetical protein [Treponema putidum]UTY27543.1 hypothetical protein E4N76_00040 [Treponema putidum]UTY32584.1 hypothetical protein E4N74_00040 [Treponema putidum]
MTVSSFFPGHIRLRGELIKDDDIFKAFERAASSHKAVRKIERNARIGSLCIEYDADALPLSKFEIFREDLPELKKLSDAYILGKVEKEALIKKIAELWEKLNTV